MTSIREVAQTAGVSVATVSRALRGLPRVSEETRVRVEQAARDLGYVASASAASLASGRTMTVGAIVPFVTRWFFANVVQGAEEVLRSAGYDLLLYNLGGDELLRRRVFSGHLLAKRVDAVLVLGSLPLEAIELSSLRGLGGPLAVVGFAAPGYASVRIDDVEAARTATEHLLGLGHRRIAFITGSRHDELHFTTPRDRLEGYRRAMAAAGVPVPRQAVAHGDFTVASGQAAARRLLSRADRPTAIFAASDEMAFGVLSTARAQGLRIPEDLSVIGIDDHEMAELFELTTVAQPVREQGRLAARHLVQALASPRGALVDTPQVVVPTRLVVRATTAPPAVRQP